MTKQTLSETVFQSKYFRIKRMQIERGGKHFTKDMFERLPVVLVLPYTSEGEIYLESQYRDAFGKTILEVVAGHIDPGEDPLVAAKRELLEETGLSGAQWKKVATWELSSNMNAPIHVFFVTDLSNGTASLEEDEEIELVKMPLTQAIESITKGEICIGAHIATLLLFEKMMKGEKM